MMTESLAEIAGWGTTAAALGLPLWRFLRHRSYQRLILETWFAMFLWSLFNCALFPIVLSKLGRKDAIGAFPEMSGIVAMAFMGWIDGLLLAAAVLLLRHASRFAKHLRQRSLHGALLIALSLHLTGYGQDREVLSYGKPVSLEGTLVEEKYPEDLPPAYRGRSAWILRLSKPISLRASSNETDEINVQESNVTEIHLWGDRKYASGKGALIGRRVQVTGTLRHQVRTVELRPILMDVSELKPVGAAVRK